MQNDDMVPIIIILCICVCIYALGCEMGLFLLSGIFSAKVQSWVIDTKYPYILKKGVRHSPTVFTLKKQKQEGMKCSNHCYHKEQSVRFLRKDYLKWIF